MVVTGQITVLEHDATTGQELSSFTGPNLIVTTGLDMIADRLRGNTGMNGLSIYALGSSSTPPVAGNTGLTGETYRATITATRVSAGELRLTLFLGSTAGNGLTFQEGGAFNVENVLLCRAVFPPKVKDATKTLTIIHTIQFTAN